WGCAPEHYPAALRLVTTGAITLRPFIQSFPLANAVDVLERVAEHAISRRAILTTDHWENSGVKHAEEPHAYSGH
ncbi:MAG TPA: hypothetical protein VF021_02190, partial [Longimicrobiales bacterium]